MSNESTELKVYSDEEIELFLEGDRRQVDRLLLRGINAIAAVVIPHVKKEEGLYAALGDEETIRARSAWIEAQITKQKARAEMMDKVASSAVTWAVIAFLVFVFAVMKDEVTLFIKSHSAAAHK